MQNNTVDFICPFFPTHLSHSIMETLSHLVSTNAETEFPCDGEASVDGTSKTWTKTWT